MHSTKPSTTRIWPAASTIGLACIASYLLFFSVVTPRINAAGANGISAALGLASGKGLTVARSEGGPIRHVGPHDDLTRLHDPTAERFPLHEPLPGMVFFFLVVMTLRIATTIYGLVMVSACLHALGAALLAWEIAHRDRVLGLLAGLSWALFLPMFQVNSLVGYDGYSSFALTVSVVGLLAYSRTEKPGWLFVAGLFAGIGLWIRSFFLLFVLAHAVVVVLLARRRPKKAQSISVWAVPVVLLAIGLAIARDPGSASGTELTRGAFWHTFWVGVGQFDNDVIHGYRDQDARELVNRLDPEVDTDVYLFQYGRRYNAVLEARAREWIPENVPRLVSNTLVRLWWLTTPGMMPSGGLSGFKAARMGVAVVSILILALAVVGFVTQWSRLRDEFVILLLSYASLVPLAAYYFIAKVPVSVYFCILPGACAGALFLFARIRSEAVDKA